MENQKELFSIAKLAREDFEHRGYDASDISDAQMERIASKMGDNYVENQFWIDVDFWGDELKMPRTKEKELY